MQRLFAMICGLCLILSMSAPPGTALAQSAEEKGLAIARQVHEHNNGFDDYTAALKMILRNRHGEESLREMRIMVLEVEGDGDKSLCIFDEPRDIKGTALLTFTHKVGDDDQWLYLPAMKRVKRISARSKSGSFVGSEFAYEDIASQELEKYTYGWVRDEIYADQECFVVDYYPVDKEYSGYTKQVTWIDKKDYRVLKVEYYDRKNSLLKTLTIKGYKKYIDKYWRADEMYMVNHQTGKSTRLVWSDYNFRTGLKDADFRASSLGRIR